MPGSPTVRRRRLALELRSLREAAGLTIEDAAKKADISKSALSRLENAMVTARVPVVRSLLQAYGTNGRRTDGLIELAREAGQRGWWQAFGDVLSDTQVGAYIDFEAEAEMIRSYEPMLIHGLLQTREYAAAVFDSYKGHATPLETQRLIDVRMKRQERLSQLQFWGISDEWALRRPVGNSKVMRMQLDRLVDLSHQSNIKLQVIPRDVGAHSGLDGSFVIFEFREKGDQEIVYTETPAGELWLDRTADIERLSRTFEQLASVALDVDQSRKLILSISGEFE